MIRWAIVGNIVLIAGALLWLVTCVLPPARAVRARNALLLRRGAAGDFAWIPATVPVDFRVESGPVPGVIAAAVKDARIDALESDWQRAIALVEMLVRHAAREGGIQADLATTYRQIVAGNGYCADYVRVYLASAALIDLFCRQWAFSFDGFGGHGHTFVEVYDRNHARWSFIDVHNNVYAVEAGTDTPLDALSLRRALLDAPGAVEFRPASAARLGYPIAGKLLDYYRQGAKEWYLWWGNDVAARERRGIAAMLSNVSGRLAHRLGSGLSGLPPLVVLMTPENEPAVVRMEHLRRKIGRTILFVVLLFATLALMSALAVFEGSHAG